jgi:hypothetical protein
MFLYSHEKFYTRCTVTPRIGLQPVNTFNKPHIVLYSQEGIHEMFRRPQLHVAKAPILNFTDLLIYQNCARTQLR